MLSLLKGLPANVWRMGAAQAVMMTVMNVNIINTGLVGGVLAPQPWLATLPLSLQFVAVMFSTLPASLLMAHFGRRPIFIIGVCLAIISCLVQAYGVFSGQFMLFVAGSTMLGIGQGIAQFYRYAAADAVSDKDKPRALSLVLIGGLMAAFIGPEISFRSFDLFPEALYAGCFLVSAGFMLVALFVLASAHLPKPDLSQGAGRPISTFLAMPRFIVGLVCAALGYALMTFLMTATPLQIVNISQLGNEANARVIQWHVIAMFAPSLFTGALISRFGVERILLGGVLFYLLTVIAALAGQGFWHCWMALVFLGLGWNFLFVGGSSIIASIAAPAERGRVQGVADFVIFTCVALCSLLAGALHSQFGWTILVYCALGPIVIIAISLLLQWKMNMIRA